MTVQMGTYLLSFVLLNVGMTAVAGKNGIQRNLQNHISHSQYIQLINLIENRSCRDGRPLHDVKM